MNVPHPKRKLKVHSEGSVYKLSSQTTFPAATLPDRGGLVVLVVQTQVLWFSVLEVSC